MDLTRLYNLTTTELQAEAKRLGIDDARALSRAQLIRSIRDRSGATTEPKGFLGKVFGIARRAIQESSYEPTPATPPPLPKAEPAPAPKAPPPVTSTRPKGAPAGVFTSRTASATFAGIYEEPFPTQTMARILAEQGHYKRSLAIYGSLLQQRPLDETLQREAEEIRKTARMARIRPNPSPR